MLTDTLSADLAVLHVFRAMQSLIVSLTTSSFVVAASLHWPGKVSDLKQVRLPPPSVKMECVCVCGGRGEFKREIREELQ